MDNKINLIKNINSDDSRFIVNVYTAYKLHEKKLEYMKSNSSITLKSQAFDFSDTVIDLDKIWCKPYFYTKMRMRLNGIIELISNIDESFILKHPSKFCKQVIYHNISKNFEKTENEIDIVDFIKELSEKKSNKNFRFVAQTLDEESLFKEEQIKKAIEIINIESEDKQYERIYDEVYSYLKKDFVSNSYCDFKNNKCVAQRHFRFFPANFKNGCCFKQVKTCPHLQKDGSCNTQCMACRLFSCPYLSKRGIEYYANEFILFNAFLTKKQRKHLVFDFYMDKHKVLEGIAKNR